MRWWFSCLVFVLGFVTASLLFLLLSDGHSLKPERLLTSAKTESAAQSTPSSVRETNKGVQSEARISARLENPVSEKQGVASGSLKVMLPDLGPTSPIQRIVIDADPEARVLFETGVINLQNGNHVEAGKVLQQVKSSHPDEKIGRLADWAIGFALYGQTKRPAGIVQFEGRAAVAGDYLTRGLDFLELEDGFGGLVETTLIDLATVHLNRWQSGNLAVKVGFGRDDANELKRF